VARCGTGCARKAGNVEDGQRRAGSGILLGYAVKDVNVKKDMQVRAVVQRSSFDHCGAPGYNIAAGRCGLRLDAAS
jgi:hypothetical protein